MLEIKEARRFADKVKRIPLRASLWVDGETLIPCHFQAMLIEAVGTRL